jgi:hypothetical protein
MSNNVGLALLLHDQSLAGNPPVAPLWRATVRGNVPLWLRRTWEYAGLLGMALAVAAAVFFAVAVGPWVRTLSDSLEVSARAIDAVDSTIEVIDGSLEIFSDTLIGVDGVFAQTEETLDDVAGVVLSTAELINVEIPEQIDSIESAMDGLIDTANVVDGILGALSFVGVDYDPEVPLDEALIDVNEQLGGLGESLTDSASDLFSVAVSVNRLNDEIAVTGQSLSGISDQLDESVRLIDEYQMAAGEAQVLIAEASDRLTGQVWVVRLFGTSLLLLLSVAFSLVWWAGRSIRMEETAVRAIGPGSVD